MNDAVGGVVQPRAPGQSIVNRLNILKIAEHAEEGIPFEVLLPLIDETSAKVHMLTPREAQTGPAVRGDMAVVQSHLQALSEDKELNEIYALISNYINKNK
jgi:predicted short-subunit dehydrogenase-like oxidoreductase (DUF2520 family)